MRSQEQLVAVYADLDHAQRRFDDLYVRDTGRSPHEEGAYAQPEVRRHVLRADEAVQRAQTYLIAARRTLDDVAGDLSGRPGRVGHDLRLLGQLCGMVDEFGGQASRHLTAASRELSPSREPNVLMLGVMLAADRSTIERARAGVQAAGRSAREFAADLARVMPAVRRMGLEQERRQPQQLTLGPTGRPR